MLRSTTASSKGWRDVRSPGWQGWERDFPTESGDYAIAFSNSVRHRYGGEDIYPAGERLSNDAISALFQGVMEASEEALLNSVLKASTVKGRDGRVSEAVNTEKLMQLLSEQRKIAK